MGQRLKYSNPSDKTDFYVLYVGPDGTIEKVYNGTKGSIYPKGCSQDPIIILRLIPLNFEPDNS